MVKATAFAPLLEMQGVTFGYGQNVLLYDVSLQVRAGEMVGLLGPNGAGKSTLLRLLSGVLKPQQGAILLEGRKLEQWGRRSIAQRVAVVPQQLNVPFGYSVEQMVDMGRMPFVRSFWGTRSQQDREQVQEALQAAGVAPLAGRIFNELSGGERQRVTIAMALAQQPVVLLLDEPTAHLDIKYQVESLELVQQLNREREVTVVAAMHDLNLAARYFPRLLLFQRGIVADAGPAEVLESALLRRVYGIDVQVGILRGSTHLSILPPTDGGDGREQEQSCQPSVHVIAGGGSGELLMRALADAKIPFVAGALNVGDSDHTLALRLADEVITEQPFSPISSEVLQRVRESLARVSLLVLCPTAIGPGNLALLKEALHAAQNGLPTVLLQPSPVPDEEEEVQDEPIDMEEVMARDYTDGKGVAIVEQLLQAGAIVVHSVGAVVEVVKRKSVVAL